MAGKLVCLILSVLVVITTTARIPEEGGKGGNERLCGHVYDWGGEDVGEQVSTNYISASWVGFEPENTNNKVSVRYDWAIISDDIATDAIRNAGAEENPSIRCRSEVGILETPDVADWVAVDSTYANNYQLSLTPGQTYFVLLRVTTTTKIDEENRPIQSVIYTNGAPITISTETKYTRNNGKNKGGKGKGPGKNKPPVIFLPPAVSSVSSLLFFNSSQLSSFVSLNSSGLFAWQIALIILSCLFALILLLIMIFIAVGRSKGEDKYETNVHRNENVEKI